MTGSLGIWIVRAEAKELGRHLEHNLEGKLCGLETDEDKSNRETFATCYASYRQWILVMATGIAVRYLQGLPKDKTTDPAIVVLDEGCRFAISLLSGHEGGANRLAYRVANLTGAVPVITTATETLKPLVVGIGCRKGASRQKIDAAIHGALSKISRDRNEIREVATIDLKAKEPGLLEWCDENDLSLRIIPQTLIEHRSWVTNASSWVRETIGVDGVCEPCALLATFRGSLVLPKTSLDGVAIAIVEEISVL
jgi:cobalt-precorrin 5A hydrolase